MNIILGTAAINDEFLDGTMQTEFVQDNSTCTYDLSLVPNQSCNIYGHLKGSTLSSGKLVMGAIVNNPNSWNNPFAYFVDNLQYNVIPPSSN